MGDVLEFKPRGPVKPPKELAVLNPDQSSEFVLSRLKAHLKSLEHIRSGELKTVPGPLEIQLSNSIDSLSKNPTAYRQYVKAVTDLEKLIAHFIPSTK